MLKPGSHSGLDLFRGQMAFQLHVRYYLEGISWWNNLNPYIASFEAPSGRTLGNAIQCPSLVCHNAIRLA